MADVTQLILSKYYGYGADPKNKKFLSSHDGTYDPNNYQRRSYSSDPSRRETTEVQASGQGTSTETAKDEIENSNLGDSAGFVIVRSSRAIQDDDILDDEENDTNEYEAFVNTSNGRNDRPTSEENKIFDDKDLTNKLERYDEQDEVIHNESFMGHFEDILPDNVSDISSIHTKKKIKKKSLLTIAAPTVSSKPPSPPRKLPSCNGVFLDLTNLSLSEFPTNILANIPNLRMLYLENNSLTTLPEELFSSLKLLQWFDVRNNELSNLPKNIKYHNCLETILLEGNLFEKLPLELCLLPSLKDIQTCRNPLIFPPADILALGFAATIHCLRCEWNKLNPDEAVESPQRDRSLKPSTILCADPPILKTISKSSHVFGSSSTGRVIEGARKISVREKSRNYEPSNRCENRGFDEELEARQLWIAKVKEMLTKQSIALQKIKDRDALSDWRRDRRSYEKSMSKAASRTEEDIPFGIDLEDFRAIFKMPVPGAKSRKRGFVLPRNINKKISELYESLNRLKDARKSETLSPRTVQNLVAKEIKKLSEMQEEIQNLRRYNERTTVPFEGSEMMLPQTKPYKPSPSIII